MVTLTVPLIQHLNEVLSIRAQELAFLHLPVGEFLHLNEVLSIRAQEWLSV